MILLSAVDISFHQVIVDEMLWNKIWFLCKVFISVWDYFILEHPVIYILTTYRYDIELTNRFTNKLTDTYENMR